MKLINALILTVALALPGVTFAMTDDESVEFMTAVTSGDVATVKKFVESGTANVNDTFFAWSPLLSAASKNQLEVVKYLAEHGADLNYRHPVTRMTAVAHAAYDGNIPLLEYLLQKGADPQIKMKGKVSVLRMAREEGQKKSEEVLLKYNAKDDGCQDERCF